MKLPKHILICGRPYKLKTDPRHDGGNFSEAEQSITIGTLNPNKIPDILLHEVGEATLAILNFRYIVERAETDNSDYRFFLNHSEWEIAVGHIATSMAGISFPRLNS